MLYWQMGREILQRQQADGGGGKVIQRLAKDLKREFPDVCEGILAVEPHVYAGFRGSLAR